MKLEILTRTFAACKLKDVPPGTVGGEFVFFARTDNEISLVCEEPFIPRDVIAAERGWRAIRVAGRLDFSLVGVLGGILNVLAETSVSVFAVSTYDTDYILIKDDKLDAAAAALAGAGHTVQRGG